MIRHIDDKTYRTAEPLFSFSVSFMTSVVNGAMFKDAGKRIALSIFRAEDLSFVLCSNLCRIKITMVSFRSPRKDIQFTLNWKLKTGGSFRMLSLLLAS